MADESSAASAGPGGDSAGGGRDTSVSNDKIAERMQERYSEGREGGERPAGLREFLLRANILDLAVAFIIGAAFGRVITSLVNDIIMPPIGLLLGGVDFSSLFINLSGKSYETIAAAKAAGAPTINYGTFLNTVIDFVIVGTALYLLLRGVSRLTPQVKAPTPEVTTMVCPYCISTVPLKATRCPYCTSTLAPGNAGPVVGVPLAGMHTEL